MGTDSGKGVTNNAPLLSSPTVSSEGLHKFLAHLTFFLLWKDDLSWRIREQPVQVQQGRWELGS